MSSTEPPNCVRTACRTRECVKPRRRPPGSFRATGNRRFGVRDTDTSNRKRLFNMTILGDHTTAIVCLIGAAICFFFYFRLRRARKLKQMMR
jgi:hypothetical protein